MTSLLGMVSGGTEHTSDHTSSDTVLLVRTHLKHSTKEGSKTLLFILVLLLLKALSDWEVSSSYLLFILEVALFTQCVGSSRRGDALATN